MKKHHQEELNHWIEYAVKYLPAGKRESAAGELQAHYEEAMDDLMHAGKPLESAHQTAMEALGAARPVAQAFRRNQQLDRHLRLGFLAGLVFPISILPVAAWTNFRLSDFGFTFFLMPTIYLLYVLRSYLSLRWGMSAQGHWFTWIAAGIGSVGVTLTTIYLFADSPLLVAPPGIIVNSFRVVALAGVCAAGIGFLNLGINLGRYRLTGPLWAIQYCALILGICLLVMTVGGFMPDINSFLIPIIPAIIFYAVLGGFLTYLFFQAFYRNGQPAKARG